MTTRTADLARYSAGDFRRGRPRWMECIWRIISALVFQSPLIPSYSLKRFLLRLFGASIGRDVLVKPRVTITLPWKLEIGDHCWIGEGVGLDSLDVISVGMNVCISQNSYLCTGNHDFSSAGFELRTKPIVVEDGAWIGASCVLGPGVRVGRNAVLTLGSVATSDLEPDGIYRGNPAARIGTREIR